MRDDTGLDYISESRRWESYALSGAGQRQAGLPSLGARGPSRVLGTRLMHLFQYLLGSAGSEWKLTKVSSGLGKAGLVRLPHHRTSQNLEPGNVHCDSPRRTISQRYSITDCSCSRASHGTSVPVKRAGERFCSSHAFLRERQQIHYSELGTEASSVGSWKPCKEC